MNNASATGSRSVAKAFWVFCGALALAGFAWAHGGWFALISFLILWPLYLVAGMILCGIEQHLMRKHPAFVPADKIRVPFVIIVVTLAMQVLITPVLTDNSSSIGYWSIISGFQRATEQSTAYNIASGFFLLSNTVIIISFIVFLVFVIQDVRRRKSQ